MKKTLILFLIATLLLSLTACGKDNTADVSSESSEVINSTEEESSSETEVSEEPISSIEVSSEEVSSTETSSEEPVSSEKASSTATSSEKPASSKESSSEKISSTVASSKVETSSKEVHKHTFANATCTTPKTCTDCKATEGAALGHKFSDATCKAPKTCSVCNVTEGNVADHKYSLGKCSVCGQSDPAMASLLSTACYGTYQAMYVESKEGQLIKYTIVYNGPTSVKYILNQFLEEDQFAEGEAAGAEVEFGGKLYKEWRAVPHDDIQNIVVTENSLSFKFGEEGKYGLNLKYKDCTLYLEDEEDGIINFKKIA